jgi:hypothetical protein
MPDCCGVADLSQDRCAPASLALRGISCHLGELVVLPADEEGVIARSCRWEAAVVAMGVT